MDSPNYTPIASHSPNISKPSSAMSSALLELPDELITAILHHVQNQPRIWNTPGVDYHAFYQLKLKNYAEFTTLRAVSLTCKRLRRLCFPLLFSRVSVAWYKGEEVYSKQRTANTLEFVQDILANVPQCDPILAITDAIRELEWVTDRRDMLEFVSSEWFPRLLRLKVYFSGIFRPEFSNLPSDWHNLGFPTGLPASLQSLVLTVNSFGALNSFRQLGDLPQLAELQILLLAAGPDIELRDRGNSSLNSKKTVNFPNLRDLAIVYAGSRFPGAWKPVAEFLTGEFPALQSLSLRKVVAGTKRLARLNELSSGFPGPREIPLREFLTLLAELPRLRMLQLDLSTVFRADFGPEESDSVLSGAMECLPKLEVLQVVDPTLSVPLTVEQSRSLCRFLLALPNLPAFSLVYGNQSRNVNHQAVLQYLSGFVARLRHPTLRHLLIEQGWDVYESPVFLGPQTVLEYRSPYYRAPQSYEIDVAKSRLEVGDPVWAAGIDKFTWRNGESFDNEKVWRFIEEWEGMQKFEQGFY